MNVHITTETRDKLWAYIRAVKTEVGGFGYAFLNDAGDELTWDTVFLVPQTVTSSEVEFLGGGIADAIQRAADDGVLGQPGFVWVSWHSHHTMKAFWSKTDEDCIKTYGGAGVSHLLSFVGCHDYDYKCRVDSFGVKHIGLDIGQVTINDLAVTEQRTPEQDEFQKMIREDIAGNVRQPPPPKTLMMTTTRQPQKSARFGLTADEAAELRDLMTEGLSYDEARDLVTAGDYFVGAADENGTYGFDTMAWGD